MVAVYFLFIFTKQLNVPETRWMIILKTTFINVFEGDFQPLLTVLQHYFAILVGGNNLTVKLDMLYIYLFWDMSSTNPHLCLDKSRIAPVN